MHVLYIQKVLMKPKYMCTSQEDFPNNEKLTRCNIQSEVVLVAMDKANICNMFNILYIKSE